jgi:hypothetical protein
MISLLTHCEEAAPMTDWPKYESHKIVQAAPIMEIVDAGGNLTILCKPFDDHTVEAFYPTEPAMIARAEVGGYAVVYSDGFKSVSPKKAFEEGYTRV